MPRRGENIFKRKDGRWEARYVKEIGIRGQKKYGSVYAATYKQVKEKQWLARTAQKAIRKSDSPDTVGLLSEQWLRRKVHEVKRSTYQKYEGLIRNHINPHLAILTPGELDRKKIEQYKEYLLIQGNGTGSRLSEKTVNDILIILRMIFSFAEEEYGIPGPKIHLIREEVKERRVLTEAEQHELTSFLLKETDIYKFGILFALYTGLRIGELCALNWDDISENTVTVTKTMQRLKNSEGKTEIYINAPKSRSSVREIPLPEFLKPYIRAFRKERGYVLSGEDRLYTEPRTMQYKFKAIVKWCGLEDANFHALRHTFATRCVESGFDVKSLSEILGHSDVKTTLNKYVHSSLKQKQRNMQKLNFPEFWS